MGVVNPRTTLPREAVEQPSLKITKAQLAKAMDNPG